MPEDRRHPAFKLLIGRLYNAGVKGLALRQSFRVDRKAAAKRDLRLDLQSFLPRFAILDTARDADAKRAREVCAGLKAGEIVIFDKA